MSLIRAVEKFDFSGNKFSTYASWAIMKNFARTIPEENYRRDRFVTGHDEMFEAAADNRTDEHEYENALKRMQEAVKGMLGHLDDRERRIIISRYGLNGASEQTLEQLGRELGITKERVRQIESRAGQAPQDRQRGEARPAHALRQGRRPGTNGPTPSCRFDTELDTIDGPRDSISRPVVATAIRPANPRRGWLFPASARKNPCNGAFRRYIREFHGLEVAGVAQSAEHRFCKPTVVSSTLTASFAVSGMSLGLGDARDRQETPGRWAFVRHGWIPKWLKGPDCKSGGNAFAGSNPAPPTPVDENRIFKRKGRGLVVRKRLTSNRRPDPGFGLRRVVVWGRPCAGVTQW